MALWWITRLELLYKVLKHYWHKKWTGTEAHVHTATSAQWGVWKLWWVGIMFKTWCCVICIYFHIKYKYIYIKVLPEGDICLFCLMLMLVRKCRWETGRLGKVLYYRLVIQEVARRTLSSCSYKTKSFGQNVGVISKTTTLSRTNFTHAVDLCTKLQMWSYVNMGHVVWTDVNTHPFQV